MLEWPDSLLNAFDAMSRELPEYSAYLFAACYRRTG
jgi:hypothetical protein